MLGDGLYSEDEVYPWELGTEFFFLCFYLFFSPVLSSDRTAHGDFISAAHEPMGLGDGRRDAKKDGLNLIVGCRTT